MYEVGEGHAEQRAVPVDVVVVGAGPPVSVAAVKLSVGFTLVAAGAVNPPGTGGAITS